MTQPGLYDDIDDTLKTAETPHPTVDARIQGLISCNGCGSSRASRAQETHISIGAH